MEQLTTMLNEDACWLAVVNKDRTRKGDFFFGVTTTGVFCRPACPARLPRREHVRFYETASAALQAGLRPCRRCRPLESAGDPSPVARISMITEYIRQHADQPLTLEALSRRAGLSRFHFQRSFKALTGVSPKEYVDACRFQRFKTGLRRKNPVTDAIYDAGFGSGSRVYERTDSRLGMTPAAYRAGGKGLSISCASISTPIGLMLLGATDRGLCFVQFGDSHERLLEMLRQEYPLAEIREAEAPYSRQFELWITAINSHLHTLDQRLDLPVDVRATAFQLRVWRFLQTIPSGEVRTYAQVAKGIGQPNAARAVARACASNRVAIVIPCHRVIRGTGAPGGYRWGAERKRLLLKGEKAAATPTHSSEGPCREAAPVARPSRITKSRRQA